MKTLFDCQVLASRRDGRADLAIAAAVDHNHVMTHTTSRPAGGYPLIALFLVITACGIIASLIGPAARAIAEGKVGAREAIYSSIFCTLVVTLVGGVVGMFHYRRARGLGWGMLTGAVIGIFVGPLILAPHEAFGAVLTLSFGGATVIVLLSVAFRIASRK